MRPSRSGPEDPTFLVASTSITAHTLNASKLVTGLVEQGHRVLWYADERFARHVLRCGAEHVVPAATQSQAFETSLVTQAGELGRVRSLYRDQVAGRAPHQLDDLRRLTAPRAVDAVVSDTLIPAAVDRWIFEPCFAELNDLRTRVGVGPAATWRHATMSAQLHMQGCTPGFEYPRRALPEHIRFIGALGPGKASADPVPGHLTRRARSRPLAVVTQGTLRSELRELVVPASQALVAEGYDVLVAGAVDGAWNRWAGRVHPVRRVDYPSAMAEADLFVTNGGYTGVTLAIDAGVPIVQAGNSEEKPDIGARIAWSGVGASLRTTRPSPWLLRRAIRRVMASEQLRAASERLALEAREYNAASLGAGLLIGLVGVLRG